MNGRGHYDIGLASGRALAGAIAANVDLFWDGMASAGLERAAVIERTFADEAGLPGHLREEIRGMADGSGREYRELLAYNLYRAGLACDC
jgi:hypothetical protein